ncbi:MAG: efflux RND transporter permease subunit [Opitutales bacterium]
MIEGLIRWCTHNRFLVLVFTVVAASAGIFALRSVKLDAVPDLSDVQVIVFTEWPGRAPTLVEDQVTYPIVSTLAAAPKVRYARGQSFFGLSFVNVIFEDGTDMYWARSRVLEYMDQARGDLPEGVTPTLGPDATGVGWVFQYALVDRSGQHSLADLRSYQDWTLRTYLQNTPGVAEVASLGGYVDQYQIVLDPLSLRAHGVAANEVIAAVRRSNNDVGGRLLEFGETEYMLRGLGYIENLEDIEQIALRAGEDGTPLLLKDVAEVRRGPDIRRGVLEIDGEGEAAGGIVVMRYGENALKTIDAVKDKLAAIEPSLPDGVEIVVGYDRSDLILRAIDHLQKTLLEEMLIVSVVILVFLLHFRSALVAIIALPLGVLLAFIPMQLLDISSNIMSLGGIAIAIGAMVDASIVFIENAHKWLARWHTAQDDPSSDPELAKLSRLEVVTRSAQQVGRPLFFSLLVIGVSFLPVFALEAQSGRLFKPLAYTKTFSMLFAALLAVTLVPVLITWLVRGKIPDERKNPVSRVLIWLYRPFVRFALRFRWLTVLLALLALGATWWPYSQIGSEFMPPLNEGSLLYMPTSPPGMAINEAREVLHRQNRIIKAFPEVERVYGKIGRARTATDPAPLSMVETTITLKPESEWRPGMTFEKIKQELGKDLPYPGMPAIWWMPIQTRIEMLATGIRSQVGVKVLGPDLQEIERIAKDIEEVLKTSPHTASAFAERVTGGYYVDFEVDRAAIARYGLHVEDVLDVIETAIGGKNIDETIEGRQRFPINVRYARDYRDDLDTLRQVPVSVPHDRFVPLGELADIRVETGPPMVRNENGQLAGIVFVDTNGIDLGGYVAEARQLIRDQVDIPAGYYIEWGGQFQYLLRAKEKLSWIIPLTLVVILILLYLNFRNVVETLIVSLSVPFALIGGVWLLWALDYNFSVAVAVGFIALAGVAAETGVVMIVYLDEAWKNLRRRTERPTAAELRAAVMEGAVDRVRPKLMTVGTTILGLMPILLGHGTGAETMKRIAAPMVGGMVSSTILTLIVIPALYALYRSRECGVELAALDSPKEGGSRRRSLKTGLWVLIAITGIGAGALLFRGAGGGAPDPSDWPTVHSFETDTAQIEWRVDPPGLRKGENAIALVASDPESGAPLPLEAVDLALSMDMPGMVMRNQAQWEPASATTGTRIGTLTVEMEGEWIARLTGTAKGEPFESVTTINVKP